MGKAENGPLLAAWAKTLVRRGDEAAVLDTRGRRLLRFCEIEEWSRHYASESIGLTNFGAGEIVAFQIGNHPHWPALFLACLRRGVAVLPIERTVSESERASALRSCGATGLLTEPQKPIACFAKSKPNDWQGRPPVLLKLTSGTTAAARAIRFRSAQLVADAEQICDTMGINETDLNFGVIPLSHSYGFSNLITPLLIRGVPMVVSNDRMPRAVLNDLACTEATVFPGMPLFYQAFVEMPDVPVLPKLRLWISAGAPLKRAVARAFRQTFGKPIHSFYGASECGGICYDTEAINGEEDFVGQPMRGVQLEPIALTKSATQVRVQSAAVGDGYFPEPDGAKLGEGVFVPDDLLTMDMAGVRIVGRVSDVINVAGKKVNPAEVEAHLLSHQAVRQAVVFGRSSPLRNQEVVACVVASADTREADLLDFCRTRLSGWQVPKRIYLLDALPANERGKISRRELAQQFAT
ncbi:MAG TPA: class I adenylate-forming enzyme family protein [Chthoniobacterales bacterium]